MAAKKKMNSRPARPSGKKGIAKKAVARNSSKGSSVKRTRKAASKAPARAAAPARQRVHAPAVAEPLFRAAEFDNKDRKPMKKAEPVRPARPPAKLPIPQSTFFF